MKLPFLRLRCATVMPLVCLFLLILSGCTAQKPAPLTVKPVQLTVRAAPRPIHIYQARICVIPETPPVMFADYPGHVKLLVAAISECNKHNMNINQRNRELEQAILITGMK